MRDKPSRLRQFAAAAGRLWHDFLRRSEAEVRKRKPLPRRHIEIFARSYRHRPSFRYMI